MVATHWVLVADAAHAQVYESDVMFEQLLPLDSWVHPASRVKAADLVAGDRGATREGPAGTIKSAFERHTDPHRATVDAFARELAGALRAGRVEHRYERLVLVAPPVFLGHLRQNLDHETSRSVVSAVSRDWFGVEARELAERVRSAVAVGTTGTTAGQ